MIIIINNYFTYWNLNIQISFFGGNGRGRRKGDEDIV